MAGPEGNSHIAPSRSMSLLFESLLSSAIPQDATPAPGENEGTRIKRGPPFSLIPNRELMRIDWSRIRGPTYTADFPVVRQDVSLIGRFLSMSESAFHEKADRSQWVLLCFR